MVQCKTVNRGTDNQKEGCLITQGSCVPLCFLQARIIPPSTSRDNCSFSKRLLNNKKCIQVEVKGRVKEENDSLP